MCTAGNPEYYFTATLVNDASVSIPSSELLSVSRSGAVCGNNIIEQGEICDNNNQACQINGYNGNQQCNNQQCSGF